MSEASRNTLISTSDPVASGERARKPALLPSLGRLVRGLSALFWGLPAALVVCVQTARTDSPLGMVAPLAMTGLLLYGLWLLGSFQPQERIWMAALDRARALALINLGISPFLYWWNRMPWHPLYNAMAHLMLFTGLFFLFTLNPVLQRLTAMLPDETLRVETRIFSNINRGLLIAGITFLLGYFVLQRLNHLPQFVIHFLVIWDRTREWIMLFLVLPPTAITMALLWKTKEVILNSVFRDESL
jgi:hypothetical protein